MASGGYAVDEIKIRARRERSFAQLPWFLNRADMALIYDNSGSEPRLMADKIHGIITVEPTIAEPIRRAIATLDDAGPAQF